MIYVIGAVTGHEADNRKAFEHVRKVAMQASPHEAVAIPHDYVPKGTPWREAMRMSLAQLVRADVVYVVDDGTQGLSRGYALERLIVTALAMPVVTVEVPHELRA